MNIGLKRILISCLLTLIPFPAAVWSQSTAPGANVRHVSAHGPVQGASREMGADRPVAPGNPRALDSVSATANAWKLQATLPGAVIHDISFPTPSIGYAVAELGQVWKTTDGGSTWTEIMNLGFPYYWYGVKALNANQVVISGFNDSNNEAILRWSHDGGATWTSDIVLSTSGWSGRVRFANARDGLVLDLLSLTSPNTAHYSTSGGPSASAWRAVTPDPNGGWFGDELSLLGNLHARASGITYCASGRLGAKWTCGPSIDSVFDGPVFFANDQAGWVGGGEISPNVEGWVHRTTDGGKTWTGRTLDDPWPIRELFFLTPSVGWAAGGNIYTNVGGIYFSSDGGQTWSLDLDTNGAEMDACDSQSLSGGPEVWCAGYDGSLNGVVYKLQFK